MIKQDYILKQIEITLDTLIFILTGKRRDSELISVIRQNQLNTNDLYKKVHKLLKENKICEAEDLIFEDIEEKNIENLYAGVLFYNDLKNYDEEELKKYNFSIEEIDIGLIDLKNTYKMF